MPRKNKRNKRHIEVEDEDSSIPSLKHNIKPTSVEENFTATIQETLLSNAKDLILENFSIYAHKCQLFTDTSLKIPLGTRAGVIGRNGFGKTTVLKHIAERLLPIHPDMDVLYVDQDFACMRNLESRHHGDGDQEVEANQTSVFDMVMSANQSRLTLIQKSKELTELVEDENHEVDEEVMEEYQRVQEELMATGADRDESLVRRILIGLGFSTKDQARPTEEFSGGWRMRVSLARALYMEPTLLMLDEPTNHLDLNAAIWLSQYLTGYKKSLLIVSHNQSFLNEVCTIIINIEKQKLAHYHGNFDSFQRSYKQKLQHAAKEWHKVEKELTGMRRKSKTKKEVQEFLKKKADAGIVKPEREYTVRIQFNPVMGLTHPVIAAYDLHFGYPDAELLFKGVEFGIGLDTRIVLVGPNGVGKSTLLNLLIGNLQPDKGEVRRNHTLRIGYYNQHFVDFLPLDKTPIEYIQSISILDDEEGENTTQSIRKYLGMIGLDGPKHLLPIEKLSGGQKARVAFTALFVQKPHVIFLDEPTNHLDIESINGLIEAINGFNGGIIMVSHDVELITRTNAELWVCQDQNVKPYPGDYEDYRDEILSEMDLEE